MLDTIRGILETLSSDIWLFVALGIIAVSFIICLVLMFVTGNVNKFKKAVKAFLANPSQAAARTAAKQMPIKVTKLYKRSLATSERPSDVIGIDACINTPYQMSVAPKAPIIVCIASIFAAVLSAAGAYVSHMEFLTYNIMNGNLDALEGAVEPFAVAFTVVAVAAAAGFIFTILTQIINSAFYSSATKVYDKYVDELDKLSKGGNFENVNLDDGAQNVPAEPVASVQEEYASQVMFAAQESNTIDEMPAQNFNEFKANHFDANDFSKDNQSFEFDASPVGQGGEFAFESQDNTSQDVFAPSQNVFEPELEPAEQFAVPVFSDPEPVAVRDPIVTTQPSPVSKPSSAEEMRKKVEEARLARTQVTTQKETPVAPIVPKATPTPKAATSSGSTDDLLQKIGRAIEDEAPLATLKDLALRLQQERAKPDNKTPEKQKKLSETQIKLMRAMTTAMKK